MVNFDEVIKRIQNNIIKIGQKGSGSGKANALVDVINHVLDIDKIYLYAKDPYEAKYQFSIKIGEEVGTKHLNDFKSLIECSNDTQDVFKNIEKYNPGKECKVLIVFDDKIVGIYNNKKVNSVVTDLFIRCRKLKIYLVFVIHQILTLKTL